MPIIFLHRLKIFLFFFLHIFYNCNILLVVVKKISNSSKLISLLYEITINSKTNFSDWKLIHYLDPILGFIIIYIVYHSTNFKLTELAKTKIHSGN